MKRNLLVVIAFTLLPLFSIGQAGPCVGSETLTATPPPSANGTYYPGTVVTFCYSVTDYAQSVADWLCGAVPTLGPGWDLSTLQPVSAPASCDGLGVWGWYTSCTGTASTQSFGPGFYYDSPSGSPGGTLDGIPGNNFGDNCQTYTWTFCFSVQVSATAPNGADLTVTMTSYSDYTVGSWGQDACDDPPNTFNTINATVANCVLIVPTVAITNATCDNTNDGSITVTPNGLAPYTYLWNTGATTSTVNNLAPGIYTVTVTDSTLCFKVVTIPVGGPQPILSNATLVPNGCDTTGGSIFLLPSGGNGSPFTYLWNNGATTSAITNLAGGIYIVTITDSLSCSKVDTFTINTTIPISLTGSSTPVTCVGNSDGTAAVAASGGVGPYTYLWSTGATTSALLNVMDGVYTVIVTDAQGCISQIIINVAALPGIVASAGTDTSNCSGQPVTLNGVASGGTGPYNFSWDNGAVGSAIIVSPTLNTIYTVLVTDANGCTSTSQVTVNVNAYPVITLSADIDICFGSSTQVQASGGSTYSWSPSNGLSNAAIADPFASPQGTTTYVVTVSNGFCESSDSLTVFVAPELIAGFSPDTTQGEAPLTVNFTSNTIGAISYEWNFGDGNSGSGQSPTHIYTQQGNYEVTLVVTNTIGCTDTARFSFIVVDELASLTVPNIFTPNGDGLNDTFEFVEKGISSISVNIFNRWGKEVYSWSKLNGSWDGISEDGEQLPDGVYLYVIKSMGIDDKSYDFQGTVQMIRSIK